MDKLQSEEGLKAASKLASRHIHFQKMKVKVLLAVPVLSSFVGNAFEFAAKDSNLSQFQGS